MFPILDSLWTSQLGCDLAERDLKKLAAAVEVVHFGSGSTVIAHSDANSGICVVAEGRVRLTTRTAQGDSKDEFITVGEHFGEQAALTNERRDVSAVAVTDTTLLELNQTSLERLMREIPGLAANLSRVLSYRLQREAIGATPPLIPRVVGVVAMSARARYVLPHIANSLTDSGESIRVIADSPLPSESQNSHLAIAESGQTDDGQIAWLRHQLHQQSIGEGHTFLSLSADASRDKLARTVSQTDQIWWLVEPQYAGRARQRLSELLADHPGLADRIRWIWVLNNESVLSRVPETPEQLTSPALRFVLTGSASDRLQKQSVSRLVHELRQTRIGIALGGGAARGLAHLGVLKVLEREGIFVDRITGTSAGALMALPYAFGWDPDTIAQTFASDLTPSWPFRLLPRGKEWFMLYKFRTGGWEAMLRHHFDHVRLEQLLLPLSTVTADLITGKEIVRDTGDAVHGVLESINLPAISRPILRDGMALVDGGTLNNVPTDLLSQRGADLVIGVNIASRLPHSFAGNTLGTSAEKMRRPGQLETIMRTNDVQDHAISAFRSSHADFRIDVDTSAFGFADFTKAEQLMQLGEQQAEMVVPELKKLIANRERTLADAASLRFVCPNQLAPASSLPAEASDNSDSRTAEKHGILVAAG